MKHLLQLLIVLPLFGFSQCPPDLIFNSQAEIDAFPIEYPDCTNIEATSGYLPLTIEGDDITDLGGLSQITNAKSLGVYNNPLLQSLDGLNPDLQIGGDVYDSGIYIENNSELISIEALENGSLTFEGYGNLFVTDNPVLSSLVGLPYTWGVDFRIENNPSLVNLEGSGNVNIRYFGVLNNENLIDFTGLGTKVGLYSFTVSDNPALESFNGANVSGGFQGFTIENNPNLIDIASGFNSTSTIDIDFGFVIRNNDNLSACNVDFICSYLVNPSFSNYHETIIENNLPGCNSRIEVELSCEVPPYNDDCYHFPFISEVEATPYWISLGESITSNNEFATASEQVPTCNDLVDRQDIWFGLNSGSNTTLDFIIEGGYSMQLWTEDGWASDPVANGCGNGVLNDIVVTPDTVYFVQVWDDGSARNPQASGWFDLTVQGGTLSNQELTLKKVKVFPNPAKETLNINSFFKLYKVRIVNLLGQEVVSLIPNSKNVIVDFSSFKEGMYLVTLTGEKEKITYKVIK